MTRATIILLCAAAFIWGWARFQNLPGMKAAREQEERADYEEYCKRRASMDTSDCCEAFFEDVGVKAE